MMRIGYHSCIVLTCVLVPLFQSFATMSPTNRCRTWPQSFCPSCWRSSWSPRWLPWLPACFLHVTVGVPPLPQVYGARTRSRAVHIFNIFMGLIYAMSEMFTVTSFLLWVSTFNICSSSSTSSLQVDRSVPHWFSNVNQSDWIVSQLFSQFGIPEVLVKDNSPCFVSEEFETFLSKNGIKHVTSAPFHQATNELAERAVQIAKKGFKKEKGGTMASRIAKVLMAYRTTPQSTTGVSPSELLQGRRICTHLDLLKPSVTERVEQRQLQQKLSHDSSSRRMYFSKGETVYAQNFGTGQKWMPAVVQEVTGPVSFPVKLQDSHLIRRHQDHLRHPQLMSLLLTLRLQMIRTMLSTRVHLIPLDYLRLIPRDSVNN